MALMNFLEKIFPLKKTKGNFEIDTIYDDIKDELRLEDRDVSLEIKNDNNETITFFLKKTTDIVTPGLGVILGNPHTITVERTIAYE